ncbi:MAG: FtsX-like permease family protein [Candidatus Thermoplasmatota archaeon]|nr:FtsX-like permease family protein [Candidatus Thermoplasmatota archaeon]
MRKTFLKKGVREIWAHKFQYIFLILILGLGVAAFGALNDMQASRFTTFDGNYEDCRFQDLRIQFQYGVIKNISEVAELLSSETVRDDISDVEYRFAFNVFINHTVDGEAKITKGIVMGYDYFDESGDQREITVNRPLPYGDYQIQFGSDEGDECYIEHNFAQAFGLDKGSSIEVIKGNNTFPLSVSNDVAIPEYFMVLKEGSLMPQTRNLGVIMVPMETAQRIHGSDNGETYVNDIVFLLKDPDRLQTFKENIINLFQTHGIPVKTIEKEEDLARYYIKDDMEGDTQVMRTFPVVIFLVSGFGLFMALRRMIQTHRVQIGIFKSLGVPNRVVMFYFASIGIMVAILGIILGLALSVPLNIWFLGIVKTYFGFPVIYYSISWGYYVASALLSLGICLACTLLPAMKALSIRPVDAIQQREGVSKRKVGRLATKVGRRSVLPTPLKLTIRNILRKPSRSVTSILGVGLSLSLFLSFMIITQTMLVMVDDWNSVNRWDYEVEAEDFFYVNNTDSWKEGHPEIVDVNPCIFLPTNLSFNGDEKIALIYALEDIDRAFKVVLDEGEILEGQLVISFYHRDALGIDVGDRVTMSVPVLVPGVGPVMTPKEIIVCGIQSNNLGFVAFTDIGTIQNMTGFDGMANIAYLDTRSSERSIPLENSLIKLPGVSSVSHYTQTGNLIEEYFDLFMGVVYAISIISTALAAAIIYNLFMISTEEKRRDYATMKTLGTSLPRIGKLIFLEAGFITVPGIILGAVGGWGLAYYMLTVGTDFEGINITLSWSWIGFLVGSLLMILTVLAVSLITIRYISRILIADVIRERSY